MPERGLISTLVARAVQPARRAKLKLKQKRAAELALVFVRSCARCGGDHQYRRTAAGCDYQAGDEREAAAIDRWQRGGGAWEWELRNRPWARSDWERDGSPWTRALAELGHPNWRLSE